MSISDERARILRMVAAGTVSPAEAEDLLAALDSRRPDESQPSEYGAGAPEQYALSPAGAGRQRSLPVRSLTIHVAESDKTKVNLRVPLGLARAASKFMPRQALRYLEGYDIKIEQLLDSLSSGTGDGTLVNIEDGDTTVRIAVE